MIQLAFWFLRKTMPFWWILAVLIIPIAKVCKVVDWSWWWVLFPAWSPVALVFILPGSAILFVILFSLYKAFRK